jgi:hypothetical protein
LRFDAESGRLRLTALYDGYGGDFRQVAGSVEAYAARYSKALRERLEAGKTVELAFLDYDWKLNRQERKQ